MTARLAVVTSGFPRVSETFALNELLALRERDMLAGVFATKPGDWSQVQPQVGVLRDLVRILPDGDVDRQADALVAGLPAGVTALHGYFAHRPAAVAAAGAARLGLPYGFSAHALDVRKVHPGELAARAARARAAWSRATTTRRARWRATGCWRASCPTAWTSLASRPEPEATPPGRCGCSPSDGWSRRRASTSPLAAIAQLGGTVSLRIIGAGPDEARLRQLGGLLGSRRGRRLRRPPHARRAAPGVRRRRRRRRAVRDRLPGRSRRAAQRGSRGHGVGAGGRRQRRRRSVRCRRA